MNHTHILASAPHQAAWSGTPVRPAERRHAGLSTLRNIIAIWGQRRRFRWELAQMAKANPHLIWDIGLTRRQVEAEIAKPFW